MNIWALLIIVQSAFSGTGTEPAATTIGPYHNQASCEQAAKTVQGISFGFLGSTNIRAVCVPHD